MVKKKLVSYSEYFLTESSCSNTILSSITGVYTSHNVFSPAAKLVFYLLPLSRLCVEYPDQISLLMSLSLQDIKLALCQMIGQSAAGQGHEIFNLTEKELLYKQKIGMELLEVANIISPGISRLRGVILYELQATLACYARRKFSAGEISVDHMKNVMKVRYQV